MRQFTGEGFTIEYENPSYDDSFIFYENDFDLIEEELRGIDREVEQIEGESSSYRIDYCNEEIEGEIVKIVPATYPVQWAEASFERGDACLLCATDEAYSELNSAFGLADNSPLFLCKISESYEAEHYEEFSFSAEGYTLYDFQMIGAGGVAEKLSPALLQEGVRFYAREFA